MKIHRHIIRPLAAALLLAAAHTSCLNEGLLYDDTQRGTLYFVKNKSVESPVCSFVFELTDEMEYTVQLNLMGMPRPYDREFHIDFHPDTIQQLHVGGITYPVENAVRGADFDVEPFIVPADSTKGIITFKIHRTPHMDKQYLSILMTLREDDEFIPLHQDYYRFFLFDGDLSLPAWWNNGGSGSNLREGWQMYIGNFYPEKFRKMLELYNNMAVEAPAFYQVALETYGEHLDAEGVTAGFYQKDNPAVWAKYVLIPLYEYYKANPLPGECEFKDDGNQGEFWRNPVGLYR